MMSAVEMKKAAMQVLGDQRVQELAQFPSPSGDNNTTTTMSNSASQDTQEASAAEVAVIHDIEEGRQVTA